MEEDDQPRIRSAKKLYEDMTTSPARMGLGHTTQAMNVADTMFGGKSKKMAKGGCACRGDGIAQRGRTKGRMV